MQYGEFIHRVAEYGGPADREHAKCPTTVRLEVLGLRPAGQEHRNLAAQLPSELKDPLTHHVGAAETFDVVRGLANSEGPGGDPEQARQHARVVLSTLSSLVSRGAVRDLRSQLPAGYAALSE